MPGEFTNSGSGDALDAITRRATITAATTYLMLIRSTYTPANSDTDSLTTMAASEYAAGDYARQPVTWTVPALNGSNLMETANNGIITFGPFTTSPGTTITYAALVTVSTGTAGSVLAFWTLDTPRLPLVSDSVVVLSGLLKLTVE